MLVRVRSSKQLMLSGSDLNFSRTSLALCASLIEIASILMLLKTEFHTNQIRRDTCCLHYMELMREMPKNKCVIRDLKKNRPPWLSFAGDRV